MTPSEIAEQRRTKYNASVAWMRKPHPDLMIVRVRPDFKRPAHQAGQYGTIGLGNWEPRAPGCIEEILPPGAEEKLVRRAYSISCSVLDDSNKLLDIDHTDWLEYYIVLVRATDRGEPAALTPRLFMLKEGDRLFLGEKITGHFTLDPVKPGDTVLFLSTGTGEAPHNYMLWDLFRRRHEGKICSACCVRFKRDLGYLAIHEELMRQHPNYTYLPLTTREELPGGHKVYIQDLIFSGQLEERLGQSLDPARTHVYLCGNPKMIGLPVRDRTTDQRSFPTPVGVVELLEKRGFLVDEPGQKIKGNIHYEEYW